jgi:chitin synthase
MNYLGYEENEDFLFCLTLLNEDKNSVINSLESILNSLTHFDNKKATLCIIADGIDMLSDSTGILLSEYRKECENRVKINDLEIIKKTYKLINNSRLILFFCVKDKNVGKLDSHKWFFNFFAKKINPKYCIQLDCGVKLIDNTLLNIYNHFNENKNIGAIAVRLKLPEEKNNFNILKSWHYCNFESEKILIWPSEIFFGFLRVLPGQCSVLNWNAMNDRIINNYLSGLNNLSVFESKKFLTEDRILACEIITQNNEMWKIDYSLKSIAISDEFESLNDLFKQRRRWDNGHFTCNIWTMIKLFTVLKNKNFNFLFKTHKTFSIFWILIQTIIRWLLPAILISTMITFSSSNYLFVLFSISILIQIMTSLTTKINKTSLTIFKITGILQIVLFIIASINMLYENNSIFNILIFGLYCFELTSLSINSLLVSKKNFIFIIKNIIQYSLLKPIMKMVLSIYAFCNSDNNSWGTKGLDKLNYGSKKFRNKFVSIWILSNVSILLLYNMNPLIVVYFIVILLGMTTIVRFFSAMFFIFKNK